ncbi:GGDEF domain-containing protein [Azospirillum sp. B510]|uniref:GGDEF domain-containing protein n=1 Tax=Azospirillum sp. (strain B510) TaxID=137722 RepID=UPI0001C4BF66|nr:GGDEF domain-containing protein [Azospirillum sp. B510]BAI72320.1 GGDEF domain-containing protein [Azospirillum sp. B510]
MLILHIPTTFIITALLSFFLALSIGLVNWKNDRDGLWTWSIGLATNGFAYVLLYERGSISDVISIIGGNFLISLTLSLFYLAINFFFSRSVNRIIFWCPPILIILFFIIPLFELVNKIISGNILFVFQLCMMIRIIIVERNQLVGRGWCVVFIGISITVFVTSLRIVAGIFFPELLSGALNASLIQTVTYVSSLANLILVSNGFLLMAVERSADRLRIIAMKDKLTDCWNRMRVEEVARHEMAVLERNGRPVSMILADLDHFKSLNDLHGHWVGDEVLIGFADLARRSVRSIDLLGRWGGEEFIILLPGTTVAEAVSTAERLRIQLESHVFPGGQRATVSLGVAECRQGDSWETWIRNADTALYSAKATGRNRTCVHGWETEESPPPI